MSSRESLIVIQGIPVYHAVTFSPTSVVGILIRDWLRANLLASQKSHACNLRSNPRACALSLSILRFHFEGEGEFFYSRDASTTVQVPWWRVRPHWKRSYFRWGRYGWLLSSKSMFTLADRLLRIENIGGEETSIREIRCKAYQFCDCVSKRRHQKLVYSSNDFWNFCSLRFIRLAIYSVLVLAWPGNRYFVRKLCETIWTMNVPFVNNAMSFKLSSTVSWTMSQIS